MPAHSAAGGQVANSCLERETVGKIVAMVFPEIGLSCNQVRPFHYDWHKSGRDYRDSL